MSPISATTSSSSSTHHPGWTSQSAGAAAVLLPVHLLDFYARLPRHLAILPRRARYPYRSPHEWHVTVMAGNCSTCTGLTCQVTMSSSKTCSASFGPTSLPYQATATVTALYPSQKCRAPSTCSLVSIPLQPVSIPPVTALYPSLKCRR